MPITISPPTAAARSLRARSREGRGEFALGTAVGGAPAVGASATLGFRPDQVELALAGSNVDGLEGQVDLVERLGDATLVHVNCAGQAAPLIVRLPGRAAPLATGSVVALRQLDLARGQKLFDSGGDAFKLSA